MNNDNGRRTGVIGGVNQNMRQINGHDEKKDQPKGEGRYNAIETYSKACVH